MVPDAVCQALNTDLCLVSRSREYMKEAHRCAVRYCVELSDFERVYSISWLPTLLRMLVY